VLLNIVTHSYIYALTLLCLRRKFFLTMRRRDKLFLSNNNLSLDCFEAMDSMFFHTSKTFQLAHFAR
jgi:hypothetical protein